MSVTPFVPMTKECVAEVLGVSIRTVENLVKSERMPAPGYIGGRVLWHPDVFYGWLDQALRASAVDDMRMTVQSDDELAGPQYETPSTSAPLPNPGKVRQTKSPQPSSVTRLKTRQATKLQLTEADTPS